MVADQRSAGPEPDATATVSTMDPVLGTCSLESLRRRKSWKWTEYPADVLPAWVAEMDFDLAEPIKTAVRDALDIGDTGYPTRIGLGEAYAALCRYSVRLVA